MDYGSGAGGRWQLVVRHWCFTFVYTWKYGIVLVLLVDSCLWHALTVSASYRA